MATFDMVIDTIDMARSLDTVNMSVGGVTTSVVAMKSAVVAQEEESAKHICQNVDNGFFMLMRSQLSQKIAKCSSQMSSAVLLMKKYASDLLHIKATMQSDYSRIWTRYRKQFSALDKALDTCVHTLDKAAFEIAKTYDSFLDSGRDSSATSFIALGNTNEIAIKSVSATVKSKSKRALCALSRNISQSVLYNKKISYITSGDSQKGFALDYLPCLYVETQSLYNKDNKITDLYISDSGALPNSKVISDDVLRTIQSGDNKTTWLGVSENNKSIVESYFSKMLEGLDDERVRGEAERLFKECNWKVLQKMSKERL